MKKTIGILSGMLIGASVYAAETPTVSGFVHAIGTYTDTDVGGDKGDVNFKVKDGAVYLQRSVGDSKVMVDLPFSADSTGAVQIDAAAKGQAYVASKAAGFNWKLGQWDTPFGIAANDSVDTTFNVSGTVGDQYASVYRGLSLGYDVSEMMGVELYAANPTSSLAGALAANNNDKLEGGLNVSAKMDNIDLKIGGMYARNIGKHHYGFLMNTTFKMDAMTLGLEVDYLKDAQVVAARHTEKWLSAFYFWYSVSDTMKASFRTEYLKHKDADIWTASVGPQMEVEKDVSMKIDYTVRRDNNSFAAGLKGGTKNFTHTVAVGAVARF